MLLKQTHLAYDHRHSAFSCIIWLYPAPKSLMWICLHNSVHVNVTKETLSLVQLKDIRLNLMLIILHFCMCHWLFKWYVISVFHKGLISLEQGLEMNYCHWAKCCVILTIHFIVQFPTFHVCAWWSVVMCIQQWSLFIVCKYVLYLFVYKDWWINILRITFLRIPMSLYMYYQIDNNNCMNMYKIEFMKKMFKVTSRVYGK